MDIADLRQLQLVQTPDRRILKVSNIYESRVTAEQVYPIPGRTSVSGYVADEVTNWREPTGALIAKYEIAWGYR